MKIELKKLLSENGKIEKLNISADEVEIKLTPDFKDNAIKVFEFMEKVCLIAHEYPIMAKMITDEDNFELILVKI